MTTKRHPENEKAKHNYLQFLRDVKGRDESSIDQVAKALERFDDYNRRRDFGEVSYSAGAWLQGAFDGPAQH